MTCDHRMSIGVVGCGHWGPNHIRVFLAQADATVSWAVDRSAERRRHVASLYDRVRVTDRLEDVLGDPTVDALVIATPAASHRSLAIAALTAGKHVLCEKPLCVSARECDEVIAAAATHRRVLMVGHVFLFNPGIRKLAQLVHTGQLGRLHYAAAVRTNLGPIRDDTNVVFDLATHEVSIFNFLLDATPIAVSAGGRAFVKPGIEDVAFINLSYPNDVIAGITASWLSPKRVREITLVGAERMATWNDLAAGPVAIHDTRVAREPYYNDFGEFQLLARDGDVTIPKLDADEPLKLQARFFLDAIRSGSASIASGERARDVVRTLEAVCESMRRGGAPVGVAAPASPAERARATR